MVFELKVLTTRGHTGPFTQRWFYRLVQKLVHMWITPRCTEKVPRSNKCLSTGSQPSSNVVALLQTHSSLRKWTTALKSAVESIHDFIQPSVDVEWNCVQTVSFRHSVWPWRVVEIWQAPSEQKVVVSCYGLLLKMLLAPEVRGRETGGKR